MTEPFVDFEEQRDVRDVRDVRATRGREHPFRECLNFQRRQSLADGLRFCEIVKVQFVALQLPRWELLRNLSEAIIAHLRGC